MTIFSVLVLLFIRGVAAVQNCHSDCVPFACHGPTEFNCEQCAGNKVLEIDRCVCKPGWFTVTTSCDTYVPNCKTIEIVSGVVSCTACQTLRDTLTAGACTRSTVPFFLRSTNTGYTGSAQDKSDANYFVTNQCLSLNTIGRCLECHKGATLQGSGACLTTNTNCFETDGSGKCTKAKPHYYIVSDTVPSFGYCVGSCRTCADGRYGRCKSCAAGFYFKLNNDSSVLGNCYPCDPSCKTCTGPLETDCSSAVSGYFVERDDPATTGKVKICSSECAHCTSATRCIFCKTKFISMDGVCSTTTNTIASCLYQYTYTANSTTVCLRYTTAFLTATDYKAYTVTASDATTKCFEYEFASDRITMRCKECLSGYILINGICTFVSGVTIASCSVGVALSTTTVACLECFPPNVISTNKAVCQTTCGASETIANVGSQVCTPCPEWCVTCQFIDQTVKCTQCEANFILYKDQNKVGFAL